MTRRGWGLLVRTAATAELPRHVRATDGAVAREVVPTVLGAPSTAEIGLANENNAALGRDATVADVDFSFSVGSIKPLGGNGAPRRLATRAGSLKRLRPFQTGAARKLCVRGVPLGHRGYGVAAAAGSLPSSHSGMFSIATSDL